MSPDHYNRTPEMSTAKNSCFKELPDYQSYRLPKKFTYPFNYEAHPLSAAAAADLQNHIQTQAEFNHDFGLSETPGSGAVGKMFGVLVVQNEDGVIGYLAGYSGKIGGKNDHPGFVPPVVDLLDENGFYRKGEREISAVNRSIQSLVDDPAYLHIKHKLHITEEENSKVLSEKRKELKQAKKQRGILRKEAKNNMSPEEYLEYCENLKRESFRQQYEYKVLLKELEEKKERLQKEYNAYHKRITQLKEERQKKSAALQREIFDRFTFRNYRGEEKDLLRIFADFDNRTPPGGAGECAAPKLLHYAYTHGMRPIALAEFWWGCPPPSSVRKHRDFYPCCKSKCGPILNFMLQGLDVEPDPMRKTADTGSKADVLYEDNSVLVINKPPGLLSVPGKKVQDSVETRTRPHITSYNGPIIVHRLDMSTSGIMVLAKNETAYKKLQQQFINRSVIKRYTALVEGIIEQDEGTVDLPLRVDLDNRPQQLVCFKYGKPAKTRWKVKQRLENYTLVYFFPLTGRTHQLRVHAAHHLGLNHPIAGDDIYGTRKERLFLHADYIRFIHPETGKEISFQAAADFINNLEY